MNFCYQVPEYHMQLLYFITFCVMLRQMGDIELPSCDFQFFILVRAANKYENLQSSFSHLNKVSFGHKYRKNDKITIFIYTLTTLRKLQFNTQSTHSRRKKAIFGIFLLFLAGPILMLISMKNEMLHNFCPASTTYYNFAFFESI